MRLFGPVRTVTDRSGREWELYRSRIVLPAWSEGGYNPMVDEADDMLTTGSPALMVFALPFILVGFVWSALLSPLLRFLLLYPVALVKGRRSRAAQIEAITFWGDPHAHRWATTVDQADSVLAHIASALEDGQIPQSPAGAVYLGRRSVY